MKTLISLLILTWNKVLGTIGRAIGLFFGGLIVGFMKGIQDQREMAKYMDYKCHMIEKERKNDNRKNGK